MKHTVFVVIIVVLIVVFSVRLFRILLVKVVEFRVTGKDIYFKKIHLIIFEGRIFCSV